MSLFPNNIYSQKMHTRVDTILLFLFINAIMYYIPYRNDITIGTLLGISLWLYFGCLNAFLLILVYLAIKGEIIIDFENNVLLFREFKKTHSWSFGELLGVYLLAYESSYLFRLRPHLMLFFDLKLDFERAYSLIQEFEQKGFEFTHVRPDKLKRLSHPFPILLSKSEHERKERFNPEIPNWGRNITLRTKLLSIAFSPMLYIVAITLVLRIPHLLQDLESSKTIVTLVYGLTAFILFDGGLYFLFGVSFLVIFARKLAKDVSQKSSSGEKA